MIVEWLCEWYEPLYVCRPPTQPNSIGDGTSPSFLSLAISRDRSGGQPSPYDNTADFEKIIYNFSILSRNIIGRCRR